MLLETPWIKAGKIELIDKTNSTGKNYCLTHQFFFLSEITLVLVYYTIHKIIIRSNKEKFDRYGKYCLNQILNFDKIFKDYLKIW